MLDSAAIFLLMYCCCVHGVVCVQFTITTIGTVGYGDIVPVTPIEHITCILMILAGASVFGYVVGSLSGLVAVMSIEGSAAKANLKLRHMKDYLVSLCVCTWLWLCMCAYACVCMHVCMYVCLFACTSMDMCALDYIFSTSACSESAMRRLFCDFV